MQEQIDALKAERKEFDSKCPARIWKLLTDKKNKGRQSWNWFQQAESVGMQEQYEFIYRYTSSLLHATPSSMFTNQKNLEPAEIRIFLEYVYVSMLDAADLAEKQLGGRRLDS